MPTAVDWTQLQPYRCYFYPAKDCPGWKKDQPCDPRCQRDRTLIPEEDKISQQENNEV